MLIARRPHARSGSSGRWPAERGVHALEHVAPASPLTGFLLIATARAAGATGEILLPGDSAYGTGAEIDACRRARWC